MKTKALWVALLACTLPLGATAQSPRADLTRQTAGYTYYNRPGATVAIHDSDIQACVDLAARTWRIPRQDPDVVRAQREGTIENCMVVRGWRVFSLPRNTGASLSRLSSSSLAAQLAPWIGADDPPGQFVREFENEASRADTIIYSMPYGSGHLLSVRAAAREPTPYTPELQSGGGITSRGGLQPDDIATLDAGTAIGIVRLVSSSRRNGGLFFSRNLGEERLPKQVETRFEPAEAVYASFTLDSSRDRSAVREIVLVFPLETGRWYIRGRESTQQTLLMDFCLGAPGFDVAAGDTLFLGTFDITGDILGPNMDMAPATALLATNPDRAGRLKPVNWLNGVTASCRNAYYTYALEVPGAPFVEGYNWGSALSSQMEHKSGVVAP